MKRPSGSLIVSIAVHVVVVSLFVQALIMRRPLIDFFGRDHHSSSTTERIGFVTLGKSAVPTPGRRGGNGLPERQQSARPTPKLVAPATVPTTLPPLPPKGTAASAEPSTGPLVGGGGELRGVQPSYGDPRLWGGPAPAIASAPKTPAQRLDSVIVADIGVHNDSAAAAGPQREPGDWTFEKNGRKYGIDRKYIRLGPISIPTAVLAMLPLNVSGGKSTFDQANSPNGRHDEIFWQAQRGVNEADFEKAVRSIRERKERERKEQAQAKAKERETPSSPAPVGSNASGQGTP